MTTVSNTNVIHRNPGLAWKVGRFLLHLLEMILAMGTGMGIFHLLERLIPTWSAIGILLKRGTDLHTVVMMVFMTLPMVTWMVLRGHGWQHSLEMAAAMLVPMAAVIVLCRMGLDAYLPWLAQASCPAMFLGMLAAMLYRRQHYTGQGAHAAHGATATNTTACH